MSFWNKFKDDKQLIIGHRGARAHRAENTMSAFEASIGKCDMVEFDVAITSDGVPIIIHDDTLNRTSNVNELEGFSKPFNVVDYTYDEILKLDFSSWFVKDDPFKTIKNGLVTIQELENIKTQRILTLEELLAFLKKEKMPANVEIKDLKDTKFHKTASKKVLDIIKKSAMEDDVIVSSFNHEYLKQIKAMDKNMEIAPLKEKSHPENLVEYIKSMDSKTYHPCFSITDESLVRELSNAGIYVNVYTVNKKSDINKLFSWGVKSVFTDFL